jgi:hypothetical protein
MHKPLDRPNTIAEMQRWEWNIPAAMTGRPIPQSVAESIGESPIPPVVEKAFKVESRHLTKEEAKAAKKAAFDAECNRRHSKKDWPAVMKILHMQYFYLQMDPGTINKMMLRKDIPYHTRYVPGESGGGSSRRWNYADILEHEEKLKANRQAALDAIDKNPQD